MPTQFEATTSYLGKTITIKTDDFRQLHQALSKIDELNRDANFLARKAGTKDLTPDFRRDQEGNEYFGVSVKGSRESVTFGQLREGGVIGFFPKGQEGYYNPSDPPQRQREGSNGQRQNRPPRRDTSSQNGSGEQAAQQQGAPQQQHHPASQTQATQSSPDDGLPF